MASLAAAATALAQDIERTAPRTLPPQQGVIQPPPAVPGQGGAENNAVLLKKLKAVVLLPDKNSVEPDGWKVAEGVISNGVNVPNFVKFRKIVHSYLGQPVSLASINRLTREIISFYRANDHPVVDVIVPEQDITSGVLQLVVIESRVGKVEAKGNRWFASSSLESQIRLHGGDPILNSRVEADLNWLNNNPFREINLLYSPGQEVGTTDLILDTKDRFPLRVYTGYENSGNAATGFSRWMAGFNWGNVFGADQQLNYQFTTSDDFQSSLSNVVTYEIPLPWRHTLTFLGAYSENNVPDIQPFNSLGQSYQASIRYKIPLVSLGTLTHNLTAGFDFKRSNNNLEFGGTQVFDTNVDILQWSATYDALEKDSLGTTTLNALMVYSPGNLDPYNTDAVFQQARAGSTCNYFYTRAGFERSTKLPWDCSLVNRGLFQWADTGLQSSEQLGVGGWSSVRGYQEGETNGDSGLVISTELRSAPFALLPLFDRSQKSGAKDGQAKPDAEKDDKRLVEDRLQFLCFWDYGMACDHQPPPRENRQVNLSGIGVGLRYTINTWVSLRFDYGWQLLDPGAGVTNPSTSRAYVGAIVSY